MSIIDSLLGAGGVAIVTTGGLVIRQALRNRKHARANAAMVERTDREADAAEAKAEAEVEIARVAAEAQVVSYRENARAQVAVAELQQVPGLLEKIDQLWEKRDECEEARRKDRQDAEERERKASEECKRETARQVEAATAPLRAQLARVSEHAADTRATARGPDDTGVHELRAIAAEARRTPTPPGGMPAQPAQHREIPPPPRGKET